MDEVRTERSAISALVPAVLPALSLRDIALWERGASGHNQGTYCVASNGYEGISGDHRPDVRVCGARTANRASRPAWTLRSNSASIWADRRPRHLLRLAVFRPQQERPTPPQLSRRSLSPNLHAANDEILALDAGESRSGTEFAAAEISAVPAKHLAWVQPYGCSGAAPQRLELVASNVCPAVVKLTVALTGALPLPAVHNLTPFPSPPWHPRWADPPTQHQPTMHEVQASQCGRHARVLTISPSSVHCIPHNDVRGARRGWYSGLRFGGSDPASWRSPCSLLTLYGCRRRCVDADSSITPGDGADDPAAYQGVLDTLGKTGGPQGPGTESQHPRSDLG